MRSSCQSCYHHSQSTHATLSLISNSFIYLCLYLYSVGWCPCNYRLLLHNSHSYKHTHSQRHTKSDNKYEAFYISFMSLISIYVNYRTSSDCVCLPYYVAILLCCRGFSYESGNYVELFGLHTGTPHHGWYSNCSSLKGQ